MEPSNVKRDSHSQGLIDGKNGQEEGGGVDENKNNSLATLLTSETKKSETKTDLALAEEKAKAEAKLEDDKQDEDKVELCRESSAALLTSETKKSENDKGSADLVEAHKTPPLTVEELKRQKQMHKSLRVLKEELRRMLNKLEGITAKAGNREGPRSFLDETKEGVDILFDILTFDSEEEFLPEESFLIFVDKLSNFKSQVRTMISDESSFLLEKEKNEKKAKKGKLKEMGGRGGNGGRGKRRGRG